MCCGFFTKIDPNELTSPEQRIIPNKQSPRRLKGKNKNDGENNYEDQEN